MTGKEREMMMMMMEVMWREGREREIGLGGDESRSNFERWTDKGK